MTAEELIKKLQTYPKDAIVIFDKYSDYAEMDLDQVDLIDGRADYVSTGRGLIRHKGHLMQLSKYWWPSINPSEIYKEEMGPVPLEPDFVTAVHFPGN